MPPDDAGFGSFEAKWLQANPEQAVVAVFLAPPQRRIASAFGCLVNEFEDAIFGIRETHVAALKLHWWRDELARAAAGHARHPVAHELFAAAGISAVNLPWAALVDGALQVLDPATPASSADAFATFGQFYGSVATIEAALVGADSSRAGAAADLRSAARLLRNLAHIDEEPAHAPLPLDLLARHGLTRADLGRAGAGRCVAIRDFLGVWSERVQAALETNAGTVGSRVRARLDVRIAGNAIRAADPLASLRGATPGRWRRAGVAWSEARRARRAQLRAGGT